MIQDQVKLPLSISLAVVAQGIRIRFGRSLVTITGVMLGIAFLMSILTGQTIREGVVEEDAMRMEVSRMFNFLQAEMGPPADRIIGLIQVGPLNEEELRLLRTLDEGDLERFNVAVTGSDGDTAWPLDPAKYKSVALEDVGLDASAVLLAGAGELPAIPWERVMAGARQQSVAPLRQALNVDPGGEISVALLKRDMHPDEIAKLEKKKKKDRARSKWIIIISLVVTVIGISNAMLMSVTERFREIGTMKCLGALSSFVRKLFLIESGFMGIVGGFSGALAGCLFSILIYSVTYDFGIVFGSLDYGTLALYFALSMTAGVILSIVAAIYPASVASKMRPADALRTNV